MVLQLDLSLVHTSGLRGGLVVSRIVKALGVHFQLIFCDILVYLKYHSVVSEHF